MNPLSVVFLGAFQLEPFSSRFSEKQRRQFPGLSGGSPLINLVSTRLEAGMPCKVITLATELDRPWLEFHGEGLEVWVVRQRPRRVQQDFYQTERGWIRTLLGQLRPECIHVDEDGVFAWAALDYNRSATVVSLSNSPGRALFSAKLGRAWAARVLRSQAVLTAASPSVQRMAEEASGQVVSMIPHVISPLLLSRKQEITRRTKNHYVAYLGGWGRLKNPRTLLRGYALLRKQLPGVHLVMAGTGTGPMEAAERWAKRWKLHEDVHFVGRLRYLDALDCLAGATALVHPVLAENAGISLIEAMWIGIPVVATRQCESSRWLMNQGRLGLLMDGEQPDQLARGMINAINPPRKTLEAARDYIQVLCGADSVLESYESAYLSACHRLAEGRPPDSLRRRGE